MAQKIDHTTESVDLPTQQFFNELAEDWDTSLDSDEQKISRLLSRLNFSNAKTIIDVGCGTGILFPHLKRLADKTANIIGIDFAESMIFHAKDNSSQRINLICGDILSLPLRRDSADIIIAFQMFPHVRNQPLAIQQCREILKSGGQLAIIHLAGSKQINDFHAALEGAVSHHKLPQAKELKKMLEEQNFYVNWHRDNEEEYFVMAQKRGPGKNNFEKLIF